MKIVQIKHENVNPDGTFTDKAGAVDTKGTIRMSKGEGCGLEGCSCSDGYWLAIFTPRNDNGEIYGLRVEFDDEYEMEYFLKNHEITL